MQAYLFSLAAGLIAGVLYSLLGVRSPAPPLIALVGLLGILLGEQIIPIGRSWMSRTATPTSLSRAECLHHIAGRLPGRDGLIAASSEREPASRDT